MVYSLSQ
jgi:hypothetical protein